MGSLTILAVPTAILRFALVQRTLTHVLTRPTRVQPLQPGLSEAV